MALARNYLSRRLHSLLEPQNLICVYHIFHSNTPHTHKIPPFHHRPFSSSPQTLTESDGTHGMKLLKFLFQAPPERSGDPKNKRLKGKSKQGDAVGLSEKTGHKESEVGRVKNLEKKKPERKLKQGEAVGLSEKTGQKESEVGRVEDSKKKKPERKLKQVENVSSSEKAGHKESEVGRLKGLEKKKPAKKFKKPRKWKVKFIEEEEEEEEVDRRVQPKEAQPQRLYDLFSEGEKWKKAIPRKLSPGIAPVEMHKEIKQREPVVLSALSLDMEVFVSYLYKEGYFRDANFVKGKGFDLSWFDLEYARSYTLSAVQKFGKDKQEISKWLSGSDLKEVAMFGCPSVSRSQVIPSKRLRTYFKIPENTVCSKCVLRDSCKFVNQSVWGTPNNNLDLAIVMKVICSYAMSLVHPQLVVSDKTRSSVDRLLKEVLKLSLTI